MPKHLGVLIKAHLILIQMQSLTTVPVFSLVTMVGFGMDKTAALALRGSLLMEDGNVLNAAPEHTHQHLDLPSVSRALEELLSLFQEPYFVPFVLLELTQSQALNHAHFALKENTHQAQVNPVVSLVSDFPSLQV